MQLNFKSYIENENHFSDYIPSTMMMLPYTAVFLIEEKKLFVTKVKRILHGYLSAYINDQYNYTSEHNIDLRFGLWNSKVFLSYYDDNINNNLYLNNLPIIAKTIKLNLNEFKEKDFEFFDLKTNQLKIIKNNSFKNIDVAEFFEVDEEDYKNYLDNYSGLGKKRLKDKKDCLKINLTEILSKLHYGTIEEKENIARYIYSLKINKNDCPVLYAQIEKIKQRLNYKPVDNNSEFNRILAQAKLNGL